MIMKFLSKGYVIHFTKEMILTGKYCCVLFLLGISGNAVTIFC